MTKIEYDLYLKCIETTTKYYFFSNHLYASIKQKNTYKSFIEHQLEDIVFLLTIIMVTK